MVCRQCHQEHTSGRVSFFGAFCSVECAQAFAEVRRQLHAELLGEDTTDLPAEVAVPDFERFALRIAAHALRSCNDLKGELPAWVRDPDILALRVKELLVQQLPSEYLRVERNRGLLGPDYSYQFAAPLPRRLVLEAAERAGVIAPDPQVR